MVAIGSGLSGQLGLKEESTYGTPVTVDRFLEFTSESIMHRIMKVESRGIRGQRMQSAAGVRTFVRGHEGGLVLPVFTKGFGVIFKQMLGAIATAGAGVDKTHTATLDALALFGKSMTVQVGRPSMDGTVRAFTYEGVKINTWELACNVDEALMLTLGVDAEHVLTATALATASYATATEQFIFADGGVTVGGTTFYTKSLKLAGNTNLDMGRWFVGNLKREPIATDFTQITGELAGEFEDLTYYNSTIAGTQAQMIITFTSPTIIPTTAAYPKVLVTLPAVEFMEAKPNVSGPEVLQVAYPFRALQPASGEPISIAYTTGDAVP